MKAQIRLQANRVVIEVEAATQKELFAALAGAEEVFGVEQCGLCGSRNPRFLTRHQSGFVFYEMVCANSECRARLELGQSTDLKTLFPRRKDDEGNRLPNGGWAIFVKPSQPGGGKRK